MTSGFKKSNRWGLKGTEDLGGGLTASFNYEAAIDANTKSNFVPSPSSSTSPAADDFNRRSVVELAGSFGKLGLGRDYNPTFDLIGATDVVGVDGSTQQDIVASVRDDNMLKYTTPNFGGFTGKIGISSNRTGADGVETKVSIVDLSGVYAQGPLMVGLAHRVEKPTTSGVKEKDGQITTLGATYDFGTAKVYFNHSREKWDFATATLGTNFTLKETNLGVSVPVGAMTLRAGVGRDSVTNGKSATDYMVGLDYDLSKRTNTYVRIHKNAYVDRGTAIVGVNDTNQGGKKQGIAVGLVHSF